MPTSVSWASDPVLERRHCLYISAPCVNRGTERETRATTLSVSFALLLLSLGVLQGMRHALEPDHLAAVSTLASHSRSRSAFVKFAAAWGAGHGAMLLLLAGALVLLGRNLSVAWSNALEAGVALMLITLGIRALLQARALGSAGVSMGHHHGEEAHTHAVAAQHHVHVGHETLATLPFVIGIVHGLAGSSTLAALAATRMPSPWRAVAFIGAYGVGAAIGMIALAALLSGPLGKLTSARLRMMLLAVSGAASIVVGLYWGGSIFAG
jgi:hypothetical protein